MIEQETIQRFVEAYAQDLASGAGERIAANYDLPSLLLMTPDGEGISVTDREELASRFAAGARMYRDHGFGDPIGSLSRMERVTTAVAIAWVNWDYRDTEGNALYDADYVYMLRHAGDRLLIASVVSVNEGERLSKWLEARSQS